MFANARLKSSIKSILSGLIVLSTFSSVIGAHAQSLNWEPCYTYIDNDSIQCAELTVPLNYQSDESNTINIPVIRWLAANRQDRLGTLFVNPGGPGVSGIEFVANFGSDIYSPEVHKYYDIISFDPRGTSGENSLSCLESYSQYYDVTAGPAFPVTDLDVEHKLIQDEKINALCAQNAGAILDHMSTADVARDIEALRIAIDEETISYLGFSYGTFLGITYSTLFPNRVDKMILDSVVAPGIWTVGEGHEGHRIPVASRLRTAQGSEDTLNQFFQLCDAAGDQLCSFSSNSRYRFNAIKRYLLSLYQEDNFYNTQLPPYDDFIASTLSFLYESSEWSQLADYLTQVEILIEEAQQTPPDTEKPDIKKKRGASNGSTLIPQTIEAIPGVTCADTDNPSDLSQWIQVGFEEKMRYPTFGSLWHWEDSICASWPGSKDSRFPGPFSISTKNKTLIINNRYDPATPYFAALDVRNKTPESRLITLNGYGHIGMYLSRCVDNTVASFLIADQFPKSDIQCNQDISVFNAVDEEPEEQLESNYSHTKNMSNKRRRSFSSYVRNRYLYK